MMPIQTLIASRPAGSCCVARTNNSFIWPGFDIDPIVERFVGFLVEISAGMKLYLESGETDI